MAILKIYVSLLPAKMSFLTASVDAVIFLCLLQCTCFTGSEIGIFPPFLFFVFDTVIRLLWFLYIILVKENVNCRREMHIIEVKK